MLAKLCLLFTFAFPVDSLPPPPPTACPVTETIFIHWEVPPIFPGCETTDDPRGCTSKTVGAFLHEHLRYPSPDSCIEGMAVVRMVVDENGYIGEVRIIRGISGGGSKEALRAVLQMKHEFPRWTPAYKRDKPVPMVYYLPVRFKLH